MGSVSSKGKVLYSLLDEVISNTSSNSSIVNDIEDVTNLYEEGVISKDKEFNTESLDVDLDERIVRILGKRNLLSASRFRVTICIDITNTLPTTYYNKLLKVLNRNFSSLYYSHTLFVLVCYTDKVVKQKYYDFKDLTDLFEDIKRYSIGHKGESDFTKVLLSRDSFIPVSDLVINITRGDYSWDLIYSKKSRVSGTVKKKLINYLVNKSSMINKVKRLAGSNKSNIFSLLIG